MMQNPDAEHRTYTASGASAFLGASAFNFLPLKIKQISCGILFRESLDKFFV